MTKLIYIKLFLLSLVALCVYQADSQAQTNNNTVAQKTEIGREDPFAGFPTKAKPLPSARLTSDNENIGQFDELAPQLFIETITLKFLNPKNLEIVLKSMSSPMGSIIADETTNSIIICDTYENIQRIVEQVKKADQTPPQIMVEVVLADVQLDNDTEIGVNWTKLFDDKRNLPYQQTLVNPLMGTDITTPGVSFGISKASISGSIHALQQRQNVEILASPRVMVLSGYSAEIKTVEEIPYQELSESSQGSGSITSTVFKEVGITLRVKATLTDNGKIMLTIEPSQSASSGVSGVNNVPIIDTRSATTTLLMDNGQVLVMGGLRKKETTVSKDQVPFFGDLPLIGFLFANNQNVINQSELLVFISPHIYKDNEISGQQLEKFEELRQKPMLLMPDMKDSEIKLFNK